MRLRRRLLRLADSYGISRTEFLKAYFGAEMRPDWTDQVKALGVRWTKFAENDNGQIGDIRQEIAARQDPQTPDAPTHASLVKAKYGEAAPRQPRPNANRGDNVTGASPYQDSAEQFQAEYPEI